MANAEVRREIIQAAVARTPGMSFRQIVASTGIPTGTTRHHLTVLMRRGKIWETRLGGRLAHFTGRKPPHRAAVINAVTATFDRTDAQLYLAARDDGPLCQKDLIAVVPGEVPRSTVQHRIKRLVRLGILRATPMGRRILYDAGLPQ